jgi:hypothetical protein
VAQKSRAMTSRFSARQAYSPNILDEIRDLPVALVERATNHQHGIDDMSMTRPSLVKRRSGRSLSTKPCIRRAMSSTEKQSNSSLLVLEATCALHQASRRAGKVPILRQFGSQRGAIPDLVMRAEKGAKTCLANPTVNYSMSS